MIQNFALTTILGIPAVAYGGMLTLFLLLSTATIGYLNLKGNHAIPFKWHRIMAILTVIVGLLHGLFGLSIFLNF